MKFNFLPLQENHLEQMFIWLNKPFVSTWYCKDDEFHIFGNVRKAYLPNTQSDSKTESFIIVYNNKQIGYIQTYRIIDYPEYNKYVETDEKSAGLDIFIGEDDFLHKGNGSKIIHQFLYDITFKIPGVSNCIICPEPNNKSAICTYEKVGFKFLKIIQLPEESEPEYLMKLDIGQHSSDEYISEKYFLIEN